MVQRSAASWDDVVCVVCVAMVHASCLLPYRVYTYRDINDVEETFVGSKASSVLILVGAPGTLEAAIERHGSIFSPDRDAGVAGCYSLANVAWPSSRTTGGVDVDRLPASGIAL